MYIILPIHAQRAERSDAVRKHVRSRISEQNLQDQTDPVPASTFPNPALPPLSLGSAARTAPGSASPPGPAGGQSARIRSAVKKKKSDVSIFELTTIILLRL